MDWLYADDEPAEPVRERLDNTIEISDGALLDDNDEPVQTEQEAPDPAADAQADVPARVPATAAAPATGGPDLW